MNRNFRLIRLLASLVLVLLLAATPVLAVPAPDDSDALAGLAGATGKALFDINIGVAPKTFDASMGMLALYLDVIKQTHAGLKSQGLTPDIIVAFRGSAVTLVTDTASVAVKGLITELAGMGIKFEACNIATKLTGTPNDSILLEIKVVGNTFISAVGYQAKGYSPILIQ